MLGWSAKPGFTADANLAEVVTVAEVTLRRLADRCAAGSDRLPWPYAEPVHDAEHDSAVLESAALGRMTATVIDLILAILGRSDHPRLVTDVTSAMSL